MELELVCTKERRKILDLLKDVGRMSTVEIGCIVNYLVENMRNECCYVNVGVWKGFSLFSGMLGNSTKVCIGVDNFSQFHRPREEFYSKFNKLKSKKHKFYEMDFAKYFKELHDCPIGVYYYDALHTSDSQYLGLVLAEPFFSNECYILIDDWNSNDVREGASKFLKERSQYEIIFEKKGTHKKKSPWWNGLVIIKRELKEKGV